MVTQKDYSEELVKAAHSVLLELFHLLGEYREDIVLVGGWVPEFLFTADDTHHVGSIDVDLALNHVKLKEQGYQSIKSLLAEKGYIQGEQPFIFHRKFMVDDNEMQVQVDLLSGEYEGTGKSHRHQKIQDGLARKARGCDLAFQNPTVITVEGELPNGAKDSVQIKVSSIVPFLVMKGMALDDRLKEKDAWDIYYCLLNHPKGMDHIVEEFRPHLQNKLIIEGLQKIAKHFESVKSLGPKFVAEFEEIIDVEEREMRERDAYERINRLLEELGIQ